MYLINGHAFTDLSSDDKCFYCDITVLNANNALCTVTKETWKNMLVSRLGKLKLMLSEADISGKTEEAKVIQARIESLEKTIQLEGT